MPLTLTLRRDAPDRATVLNGDVEINHFDPLALRTFEPASAIQPVPKDPVAYGRRLFAALGGNQVMSYLPQRRAPHLDSLIAIRTDNLELMAIPWEYVYGSGGFLVMDFLFVRVVPRAPVPDAPDPNVPWRLVAMGSDPVLRKEYNEDGKLAGYASMQPLQVVAELDELAKSLRLTNPPLPIRWQRIAPTQSALINLNAGNEPVLLHFTGHGAVADGEPYLCFDDGAGMMDPQPVRELAAELRERTYLAFLNACRTADATEPGANLALALVEGGIPVVVGTQYTALDAVAAPFAWTFYQHLTSVGPAVAMYRARRQLKARFPDMPNQWAIHALYVAEGYTWPQQQPALNAPLPVLDGPPLNTFALRAPSVLVGRTTEQHDLTMLFVGGKQIVTILGSGGMGKTALANAIAHRLRFAFPGGVYALSLVLPEGSPLVAATVWREAASLLGVSGPAFDDPTAFDAQEKVILQAVEDRPRMLLVVDNYETVLWRLGREQDGAPAVVEADQRTQADAVHRLVISLAHAGVYLLFTSRQAPVQLPNEVTYPPREQHRPLGGLQREHSAALFQQYAGEWPASPEFREQVAQVLGDHPLSLILAAIRWSSGHHAEADFLTEIRQGLHEAEQDGVPVNQRSALANVRLSLKDLSPERQRDFLALTLIGNPLIQPIHGAVLWGMEDEREWFVGQAHTRLQAFCDRSLLEPVGIDKGRNRAQAYAFQPVIAQIARYLAGQDEASLDGARTRYASWVSAKVEHARSSEGRSKPEVMHEIRALFPDVLAALPYAPVEQRGWTTWRAADVAYSLGRPDLADQLLQLGEAAAHETGDQMLDGRLKVVQGNQALLRGKLTDAMSHYQAALAICDERSDGGEKAVILHQMARVRETRGDLDGAMALYEQSLVLKEGLGDVRGKAATLHQMAGVRETRGDLDGAMALYEQSLEIEKGLGNKQGEAATLHAMAGVRETRGDLDGAMALYEQSLVLKEGLGDVRGKAATLANMSVLHWRQGKHEVALTTVRESLQLLEQVGAVRDIEQVRNILRQMESAQQPTESATLTPVQLAVALTNLLSATRRGEHSRDEIRSTLQEIEAGAMLANYIAALLDILAETSTTIAQLSAAAEDVAASSTPTEQVDLFMATATLADDLDDAEGEITARERAIAAQRNVGTDRETLVHLSVMLYNLASRYGQLGRHADAVPLLEEVVALDERNQHPDLEADRQTLAVARRRAGGTEQPTLRAAIEAWKTTTDQESLALLLNALCNLVVEAIRDKDMATRDQIAEDVAALRMVRPLPIPGTNDFLHVVQLMLRDRPGMAERATQLRATLPENFSAALIRMERLSAGEAMEQEGEDADDDLLPEQRRELHVLEQVVPAFQRAAQLFADKQTTLDARLTVAQQIDALAAQAAADEVAPSPWLDAAAGLRAVATMLRGGKPDTEGLTPLYRKLIDDVRGASDRS
jgi:tetratricopeptide (TPR) repeat protein